MFCDSDDEYERHACKNLLEAAERTGADVVCGTAERVDVRTGRVRRWRPEVHASLQRGRRPCRPPRPPLRHDLGEQDLPVRAAARQRPAVPGGTAVRGPAVHPRGDGRRRPPRGHPAGRLPLVRRPPERGAVDHPATQRGAQRREPHRDQPPHRRLPGVPWPRPDPAGQGPEVPAARPLPLPVVDAGGGRRDRHGADGPARSLRRAGQPGAGLAAAPGSAGRDLPPAPARPRGRALGDALRQVGLGGGRADRRARRPAVVGLLPPGRRARPSPASPRRHGWTSTTCSCSASRSPSAATCTGSTRCRCRTGG